MAKTRVVTRIKKEGNSASAPFYHPATKTTSTDQDLAISQRLLDIYGAALVNKDKEISNMTAEYNILSDAYHQDEKHIEELETANKKYKAVAKDLIASNRDSLQIEDALSAQVKSLETQLADLRRETSDYHQVHRKLAEKEEIIAKQEKTLNEQHEKKIKELQEANEELWKTSFKALDEAFEKRHCSQQEVSKNEEILKELHNDNQALMSQTTLQAVKIQELEFECSKWALFCAQGGQPPIVSEDFWIKKLRKQLPSNVEEMKDLLEVCCQEKAGLRSRMSTQYWDIQKLESEVERLRTTMREICELRKQK